MDAKDCLEKSKFYQLKMCKSSSVGSDLSGESTGVGLELLRGKMLE